jgi:hypothetical protein
MPRAAAARRAWCQRVVPGGCTASR